MYYLKNLEDGKLVYYCRHCGNEDHNLDQSNFKVFKYDTETKIKNKTINEFTKYDPVSAYHSDSAREIVCIKLLVVVFFEAPM